MATSMNITFDTSIDLDSLFTLNYNFDRLKAVIDLLVKNQKVANQKFSDIQEIIETKNKKINNLEKEVQILTNQVRSMNNILVKIDKEKKQTTKREEASKIIDAKNEDEDNQNIEYNETYTEKKTDENLENYKSKTDSTNNLKNMNFKESNSDVNINKNKISDKNTNEKEKAKINEADKKILTQRDSQLKDFEKKHPLELEMKDQKEIIEDLYKRVLFLEAQIKNTIILNEDMNEAKKKLLKHEDDIQSHQSSITKLLERMNYFDLQYEELKNNYFNGPSITDLLNKNLKIEGGDSIDNKRFELMVGLIKNLEGKVNQNTTQNKKLEEELNKNKTEISNIKNDVTQTNAAGDSNKEKIELVFGDISDIRIKMNSQEEKIKNLLDEMNKFIRETDDRFDKINLSLKNLENVPPPIKENAPVPSAEINESDLKIIRDLQKKLTDIERNYKILISTINLDPIYKEISKINENLNTRLGQHELNEMRNNNSQLLLQINYLKDLIAQLQDDKNSTSLEITRLKKKIDNLNSNISLMSRSNNEADANLNQSYKVVQLDHNKYVDVATFIEFKNNISKEIDGIEFTLSDIKKLIEEILMQLKAKINDTDLKNLEEYILTKLDEMKTGFSRKFADKLETSKNFKYLDQQIKHIIEVYIKRMEKGDNWLLAKKPLEGFACASCESYIGDLKENNAYVPWNKYPMRDPNDKLYRMGNGFSKMLQLINIENSPKNFQTSAEFYIKSQEQLEADQKKKNILPKLKVKNKKAPGNMSGDDIEEVEDYDKGEEIENNQEPKM